MQDDIDAIQYAQTINEDLCRDIDLNDVYNMAREDQIRSDVCRPAMGHGC